MKLPVGCFGPTDENIDDGVAWSYDAEEKRLRLVATPEIVKETPLVQAIGGADFEAVEGFWIPRPWLMSGACPRGTSAEPAPLTAPPREVGLAQFFPAAESRAAQRDGRSFESVTRVEQEELPVPGAFTLVLNGRVAALPDGSIIRCHSDSPNTRPTCLISVEFDRVSFENSTTGSTVATWQTG